VRTWLLTAPRWVHRAVSGVLFGGFMTVFLGLEDGGSWPAAVLGGVVGGLLFGLVMGSWSHRTARGTRAAIGELGPRERRIAARASWRGDVPADPDVCRAAVRMIDHQLALYLPLRTFTLVVGALFLAGYVVAAVLSSPWWWAAAAFWAGMLALSLLAPGRLRRRRALLTGTPALS
jgi:Flp pilus assembly protein TadB